MPVNIVVLGRHSKSSYAVCNFLTALGDVSAIFEQPESRLKFLKRRFKKLGPITVAGQIGFQLLVSPWLAWRSAARIDEIKQEFGLNIRPFEGADVSSVNADDTITKITKIKPDVVVLAGTRIVSKQLIENARCPILNIHAGIAPLYRGVHGAYWALIEKRLNLCGVTVHRVDTGIDTGEVIHQAVFRPDARDNFATYPWIQLGMGLHALAKVIPEMLAGVSHSCNLLVAESKLRTHPTLWGYVWHRLIHKVR
ncbi:MAG TPA: formyl transferase [Terriglobales bacterium]|nr:formyl transferase [Terriglobales bacterium]